MRSFFYPGNGHCGMGTGPQINATTLFNALVDWVENGNSPDYIVASQNLSGGAVRTRKICKYPDEATYTGAGSTDDQANFTCVMQAAEPADLKAAVDLGPIMKCKDVTVTAGSTCTAQASVDDGSANRYGQTIALAQTPAGPYGFGTNGITLTGTDSRDAKASCHATVRVVDQTAPTIAQLTASPNTLWPPNNKLVPVNLAATVADNCDAGAASRCQIVSVASNEGDAADWQVTGPLSVNLRAQRSGGGAGRLYTIGVQCSDASGNRAQQNVTVTVPHDQGG